MRPLWSTRAFWSSFVKIGFWYSSKWIHSWSNYSLAISFESILSILVILRISSPFALFIGSMRNEGEMSELSWWTIQTSKFAWSLWNESKLLSFSISLMLSYKAQKIFLTCFCVFSLYIVIVYEMVLARWTFPDDTTETRFSVEPHFIARSIQLNGCRGPLLSIWCNL